MKRTFLSFLVSISVALSPLQAHAYGEDFYMWLPMIAALLYAMQNQGTGSAGPSFQRTLNNIPLLQKLESGATSITVDRAVEVLKGKGLILLSAEDRVTVANSVMAHVMANRFWMDRTSAFSTLYLDAPYDRRLGYVSDDEFRRGMEKAFTNRNLTLSSLQKDMIQQFADVLEFESAVRRLGISAHPVRTAYLAAYLLAISASTRKLQYEQRQDVLRGVFEAVAAVDRGITADITNLVEGSDRYLGLSPGRTSINFFSNQYMPPWFFGGLVGFLTSVGGVVALMFDDSAIKDLLVTLGFNNPSSFQAFVSTFFAAPAVAGTLSSFAYKGVMAKIFRSKADDVSHELLQAACGSLFKSKTKKASGE